MSEQGQGTVKKETLSKEVEALLDDISRNLEATRVCLEPLVYHITGQNQEKLKDPTDQKEQSPADSTMVRLRNKAEACNGQAQRNRDLAERARSEIA